MMQESGTYEDQERRMRHLLRTCLPGCVVGNLRVVPIQTDISKEKPFGTAEKEVTVLTDTGSCVVWANAPNHKRKPFTGVEIAAVFVTGTQISLVENALHRFVNTYPAAQQEKQRTSEGLASAGGIPALAGR